MMLLDDDGGGYCSSRRDILSAEKLDLYSQITNAHCRQGQCQVKRFASSKLYYSLKKMHTDIAVDCGCDCKGCLDAFKQLCVAERQLGIWDNSLTQKQKEERLQQIKSQRASFQQELFKLKCTQQKVINNDFIQVKNQLKKNGYNQHCDKFPIAQFNDVYEALPAIAYIQVNSLKCDIEGCNHCDQYNRPDYTVENAEEELNAQLQNIEKHIEMQLLQVEFNNSIEYDAEFLLLGNKRPSLGIWYQNNNILSKINFLKIKQIDIKNQLGNELNLYVRTKNAQLNKEYQKNFVCDCIQCQLFGSYVKFSCQQNDLNSSLWEELLRYDAQTFLENEQQWDQIYERICYYFENVSFLKAIPNIVQDVQRTLEENQAASILTITSIDEDYIDKIHYKKQENLMLIQKALDNEANILKKIKQEEIEEKEEEQQRIIAQQKEIAAKREERKQKEAQCRLELIAYMKNAEKQRISNYQNFLEYKISLYEGYEGKNEWNEEYIQQRLSNLREKLQIEKKRKLRMCSNVAEKIISMHIFKNVWVKELNIKQNKIQSLFGPIISRARQEKAYDELAALAEKLVISKRKLMVPQAFQEIHREQLRVKYFEMAQKLNHKNSMDIVCLLKGNRTQANKLTRIINDSIAIISQIQQKDFYYYDLQLQCLQNTYKHPKPQQKELIIETNIFGCDILSNINIKKECQVQSAICGTEVWKPAQNVVVDNFEIQIKSQLERSDVDGVPHCAIKNKNLTVDTSILEIAQKERGQIKFEAMEIKSISRPVSVQQVVGLKEFGALQIKPQQKELNSTVLGNLSILQKDCSELIFENSSLFEDIDIKHQVVSANVWCQVVEQKLISEVSSIKQYNLGNISITNAISQNYQVVSASISETVVSFEQNETKKLQNLINNWRLLMVQRDKSKVSGCKSPLEFCIQFLMEGFCDDGCKKVHVLYSTFQKHQNGEKKYKDARCSFKCKKNGLAEKYCTFNHARSEGKLNFDDRERSLALMRARAEAQDVVQ